MIYTFPWRKENKTKIAFLLITILSRLQRSKS